MDNGELKAGLEGAFSKYLTGTDGKRLEQRINSSQWKPIDSGKFRNLLTEKMFIQH
jgi:cell division protein FtsI (penicillin-binding protein 3)